MNKGSGISRGDRNRNARLNRLREAVPVTNAIVGLDLADKKQMLVVCDHDSKVVARRTLGIRREQLVAEQVAQIQQLRDLLECVWPAALDTARQPFRSVTWMTAMTVVMDRDGGDLDRTRRLGQARLERLVRAEVVRRGKSRPCLRILRNVYQALSHPAGVIAHRRGAFERVSWLLTDWHTAGVKLIDCETRMVAALDELELTGLVTSIPGLSAVGAAAILAETGDLTRFATGRAVVKHAGLAPREKLSGGFVGRTKLTGQGRPGLRTAAWRAVWGAQRANPVFKARYTHLTTRETNKLTPTQAQTVIAAAILRHLHAVVTARQAWDPNLAAGGIPVQEVAQAA